MPVSDSINRLIVDRASTAEIERIAVVEGMDTLRQSGLRRVVRGELTLEELLRVTA
jgi:type IV pilus assembly protein PilB